MSWDHTKYEACCESCGKKGFCIESMDDWNRTATEWIGFDTKQPDAYEVTRKRVGARDLQPVCDCGKSRVVRGERLGECDGTGKLFKK
jgi:hypothetical protein